MNPTRQTITLVARLVAAGMATVLLGSCVDGGPQALVIVQAQIPDTEGGQCVIPAERTEVRLTQGTLDVALDRPYPYFIYPLLISQFPPIADPNSLEQNRVDVIAMEVEIKAPAGIAIPWTATCPQKFDYMRSRTVLLPSEEAAMIVEGMRSCHAALFRDMFARGQLPADLSEQVRFQIVMRAKARHGSTTILSAPFEFPVRVCFGCLQTGFDLPGYAAFDFPTYPACDKLAANPYRGNPCNPGQDRGPILCCALDSDPNNIRCPAVPGMMATPAP